MRLFVGLELPDELKSDLTDLYYSAEGIRWEKEENLHLTLQFIGEVDGASFKKIAVELKQIKHKKFNLLVNSVGHFDDRILFASIEENESLLSLQKQIVYRLKSLNLDLEVRKFKAHISLAKCKNVNYEDIAKFLLRCSLYKAEFAVNEFILFSSELSPKGSTYWHESIFLLK